MYGAPHEFEELRRRDPGAPSVVRRLVETKQVSTPLVKLAGARSFIGVPLLREDELFGYLTIYRQEVRPFTDK